MADGRQPGRWVRRTAWVVFGLLAALLLIPFQRWSWDSHFPSIEYRLRFVDADGRPVPGVRLDVFTQAGGRSYLYPVDEFVPGNPVVCDADGRMTFHHRGLTYECGGRTRVNLLGLQFHSGEAPQYDCVFTLDGREVRRVRYNSLSPKDWPNLPTVERPWVRPAWVVEEMIRMADADDAEGTRFFDSNRDGQLDREERTARRYFLVVSERNDPPKPFEFAAVEYTIVVPNR
jgi:hypothetical protein